MNDNNTIRQLNVGSLRIRYKEEDYTKEKSKNKTVKITLFLIAEVIAFFVLFSGAIILIENFFLNINDVGRIILTVVIVAIILAIIIFSLCKMLTIVYKNKDGLYHFLDFAYKLQDCDIFYNNEKKVFLLSFKDTNGITFYTQNKIKNFLQIKNENFLWNDSNFKNLNDKIVLAIDLTEYPKTKCTILQEP